VFDAQFVRLRTDVPKYPYFRMVNYETMPHRPTFGTFARAHPTGWYLVFSRSHVAVVADGKLYDEWGSGNCVVIEYIKMEPR
jgi:hypothetical protein